MPSPRGQFIWYDVMTTEPKAAAAFYSHVVGWETQDYEMPNGAYTVFRQGPTMVAGLMGIPEPMRASGMKPCWSGYIGTDDVDAEAKRIAAAGGAVPRPPEDIPNVGRFAVAADPGGAAFLVFKPNGAESPTPAAPMAPGHVAWHELYAGDLEREFGFYQKLFGWTKSQAVDMGAMGTYQTVKIGDVEKVGMMKSGAQMPGRCWNYYIAVDSVAAAAERATARGGKVLMGPQEVPGGAFVLQALDPQGARFALISAAR